MTKVTALFFPNVAFMAIFFPPQKEKATEKQSNNMVL